MQFQTFVLSITLILLCFIMRVDSQSISKPITAGPLTTYPQALGANNNGIGYGYSNGPSTFAQNVPSSYGGQQFGNLGLGGYSGSGTSSFFGSGTSCTGLPGQNQNQMQAGQNLNPNNNIFQGQSSPNYGTFYNPNSLQNRPPLFNSYNPGMGSGGFSGNSMSGYAQTPIPYPGTNNMNSGSGACNCGTPQPPTSNQVPISYLTPVASQGLNGNAPILNVGPFSRN